MKYPIIILLTILTVSCSGQVKNSSGYEEISSILTSNKSLEKKYSEIYETDLYSNSNLTPSQQKEIGNHFFDGEFFGYIIEITKSGNINLQISGMLESKFSGISFDDYSVWVTSHIDFGEKEFTSKQQFFSESKDSKAATFKITHKLINDIQATFGNNQLVWLDETYFKHKPQECTFLVELIANNNVGNSIKVVVDYVDFTEYWNESDDKKVFRKNW